MKNILSLFFCLLLLSCNNTKDKNTAASETEDTPTSSSSKTEAASMDGTLKQHSNYSALFNRKTGDCNFITEEGIAKTIGVSSEIVLKDENICSFSLTEANGTTTRFKFTVQPWGNKTILKEIKTAKENAETFGKDSKLSQYRISETGDTYLSMHQNRKIRMLNEKSNNVITILYSIETSPTQNVVTLSQQKDIARERSYAIANYLLNTHKQ